MSGQRKHSSCTHHHHHLWPPKPVYAHTPIQTGVDGIDCLLCGARQAVWNLRIVLHPFSGWPVLGCKWKQHCPSTNFWKHPSTCHQFRHPPAPPPVDGRQIWRVKLRGMGHLSNGFLRPNNRDTVPTTQIELCPAVFCSNLWAVRRAQPHSEWVCAFVFAKTRDIDRSTQPEQATGNHDVWVTPNPDHSTSVWMTQFSPHKSNDTPRARFDSDLVKFSFPDQDCSKSWNSRYSPNHTNWTEFFVTYDRPIHWRGTFKVSAT